MIHLTHPKWRALRVMDEASVKLLNRMLRAGWFVMPFGMDGVDYFIMRVPTETPELSRYPDPFQVAGARSSDTFDVLSMQNVPAITVLVLTKGERRGRQRAVLSPRNEHGWVDRRVGALPSDKWTPAIATSIEDGMLTIYERRVEETP
ncbi:MAG TPA: hypothetical protein VNA88_15375 [Candidatus Kapabacteria bacterium]|nr:hypothetical protein [Candidatus Kapabacteria bacterium]